MDRLDTDIAFERGMKDAEAGNHTNPFQDIELREAWERGYRHFNIEESC